MSPDSSQLRFLYRTAQPSNSSFTETASPRHQGTDDTYLTARDLLGREDNQIHVWCAVLSEFASQLPLLQTQLSIDEKARAGRFRFPGDRNRFIARRGILRNVLSWYVDRPPSEIEFCYGPFGKPGIKGGPGDKRVHFSVSHSGDLAVYAVARSCALGVDVERVRPIPHFQQIAGRFFSPRESAMLTTLPPEFRTEGFFACWTSKEAFLKATGEGIGEALAKVEVTVNPWEKPEILRTAAETEVPRDWQLRSFSPVPGYLAAVAFGHHHLTLTKRWVRAPGLTPMSRWSSPNLDCTASASSKIV